MNPTEVKAAAERLISQLEAWWDAKNLAPLAKLRRVFNDATRHEAWEVLGRFGPQAIDDPVYETVAGCFALWLWITPPDRVRVDTRITPYW